MDEIDIILIFDALIALIIMVGGTVGLLVTRAQNRHDERVLYAETTSKMLTRGRAKLSTWPDDVAWYDTQQRIAGLPTVLVRDSHGLVTRRYLPQWRIGK